MKFFSQNIFAENTRVDLSPYSRFTPPGQICNGSRSVVRGLDILELIAAEGRALRAIEITGRLGLSPSSANQILKTMVDAGYLLFDHFNKQYYPSPRLTQILAPASRAHFDAIAALMAQIQREYDKTVVLTACQGSFMQNLCTRSHAGLSPAAAEMARDGFHFPLFGSCAGAAWLSSQSEATVRAAVRLCRRELGQEAKNLPALMVRLRRFREQGYTFGGFLVDDAFRALAFPLPPGPDGMTLVMAVTGATEEMEQWREAYAAAIKELIRTSVPASRPPIG